MKDLSNENVIHVKKDGIQYLQFRKLLDYKDKITHCYTLKDFDLKNKSKDSDDYKKICKELNINNENIFKYSELTKALEIIKVQIL